MTSIEYTGKKFSDSDWIVKRETIRLIMEPSQSLTTGLLTFVLLLRVLFWVFLLKIAQILARPFWANETSELSQGNADFFDYEAKRCFLQYFVLQSEVMYLNLEQCIPGTKTSYNKRWIHCSIQWIHRRIQCIHFNRHKIQRIHCTWRIHRSTMKT